MNGTCRMAVVLAAVLALTGCGKREQAAKSGDGEGAVTLRFWHILNYSGPREILSRAVSRFEAANPGCRVEIQEFENDAYKTKLAVEIASGSPPDVMFTWGGGPLGEYARAGKVIDLSSVFDKDGWGSRFIDQALDLCRFEGRLYAVPLDLSAVMLWCNADLFAQHGVEFPKTYDDLLRLCKVFRAAGLDPCALGNMKQWPGAFYFCYLANRCGGTELFLDAAHGRNNASFADPAFVRAGELLRGLIEAEAFPVGFNGLDDGPARTRFLSGKAAMLLMGSWVVARVKDEQPAFLERMQAVPFPVVADGKGDASAVLGGINCGFAVTSSCKHPELAIELLRYLTDDQVVTEWCEGGRIPALVTTPEQEAKLPGPTRQAYVMLKAASSLQPYYDQYLTPRLAVEHKNTTQNMFAGVMTPEQAAAKMAAAAKK